MRVKNVERKGRTSSHVTVIRLFIGSSGPIDELIGRDVTDTASVSMTTFS